MDSRPLNNNSKMSNQMYEHSMVPTNMQPSENDESLLNESISNNQNPSLNNLNNIVTKPMNTPAGLCSLSGTSLIDLDTSNEQENDVNKSVISNHCQQEESVESKPAATKEATNDPDLDLESFISEMFKPKPQPSNASPTDSVKTNCSLKQSTKNTNSRLFKRASLQNIDIASSSLAKPNKNGQNSSIQTKRLSVCSNDERLTVKPGPKQALVAANLSKNTKIKPPQNSSSLNANKVVVTNKPTNQTVNLKPAKAPVINMTKTSQLRASAASTITSNTKKPPTVSQVVNKPKPVQTAPKNNPRATTLRQQADKLNLSSTETQSSGSGSTTSRLLNHLNGSPSIESRRRSFSFGNKNVINVPKTSSAGRPSPSTNVPSLQTKRPTGPGLTSSVSKSTASGSVAKPSKQTTLVAGSSAVSKKV
jgi:hypothetical protein